MQIKTPLLRVIVNIFGHLGYQFCPLTRDWRSWRQLAVNMTVNCWLLYFFIVLDTFEIESIASVLQIRKPFFALMVQLFLRYGNSGLTILNIFYFSYFGNEIITLLDSPYFTQVYRRQLKVWQILCAGIGVNTAIFMSFHVENMYQLLSEPSLWSLLSLAVHYVLATLSFFGCILLFYHQYAIRELMSRLEVTLLSGSSDFEIHLKSIKELAYLSDRIFDYLSFPLATFLLVNLESLIVVTCMVIFFFDYAALTTLLYFLYPIFTWAFMVYLARLNGHIIETFKRICVHFQRKSRFNFCASELSTYEASFKLRIFHLTCVDASFLLSTVLYAINYIVFLIQTN